METIWRHSGTSASVWMSRNTDADFIIVRQIFKILNKEGRQTALFSATLSLKVQDLAKVSLRPGPVYVVSFILN